MVKSEFYGSGEGVHKNPISWGGLPKEGWLKQFADLKGGEAWQKRGGGVLRMGSQEGGGGGDTPMHSMSPMFSKQTNKMWSLKSLVLLKCESRTSLHAVK